jgi:hypothetical protein
MKLYLQQNLTNNSLPCDATLLLKCFRSALWLQKLSFKHQWLFVAYFLTVGSSTGIFSHAWQTHVNNLSSKASFVATQIFIIHAISALSGVWFWWNPDFFGIHTHCEPCSLCSFNILPWSFHVLYVSFCHCIFSLYHWSLTPCTVQENCKYMHSIMFDLTHIAQTLACNKFWMAYFLLTLITHSRYYLVDLLHAVIWRKL